MSRGHNFGVGIIRDRIQLLFLEKDVIVLKRVVKTK